VDYLQRVLWTEGLFLTPHHFQQVDRYHEHRLRTAMAGLQPLGYGLMALKVDTAALAEGNFVLHACKGIMHDGLQFDLPNMDDIPPARDLEAVFGTERETLGVHLAIPVARAGFAASKDEAVLEGIPPRYRSKEAHLIDSMGLTGDREVSVAVNNLRVLFDGESLDGHISLKIAEIGRTATGGFHLVDTFVPPCLHFSASEYLASALRRILEILSTRSADLALQRRQRAEGLVDFTVSEAATFWLLHTINGAIPPLLHYYSQGTTHPELLYLEIVRVAGNLFTFADLGHPKDIPPYVHDDLGATFGGLQDLLLRLLETVIPSHCVPIPLERDPNGVFTGRIPDEKLRRTGQFYLAVNASVPDEKIAAEVPRKAKITATNRIAGLTAQFLRGLELKYQTIPNKLIPVQPGFHYFKLVKEGDHWDAIDSTGSIAFHLPPEFPDLQVELMAIKE
jgi:type VI secretion system protein ImpJ